MTLLLLTVLLNPPSWTEPVEPFRIIGNIHYIGTAELASYLITTNEGHILLDAPLDENVPHLIRAIEKLGFDADEIRIILNSHAHSDHAGGIKRMKDLTGARVLLSAADAELAARGGVRDFAFGDRFTYTPVAADGLIEHGSTVSLGGTTLTAHLTPGHTKGGTTWTLNVQDNGKAYHVVFANSMSAPGYRLVGNEAYPSIMEDFRSSFDRLRALEADVFLAPHASFFGLRKKTFVDRMALRSYIDRMEQAVERKYEKQRIEVVLDTLHDAAAKADADRYFEVFTDDAVYIGSDASERWTLEQFRAFAHSHFSKGRGWTYTPTSRNVTIGPDRKMAWFDEILENASYGTTRGTGVLILRDGEWKVAQYHLTIPVPNELANEVVKMIRAQP